MTYPIHRLRRLRLTESIRRMVCETRLSADNMIYPLFIGEGDSLKIPLESIPGARLLAGPPLIDEAKEVRDLGIPAVLLFAVLDESVKDDQATYSFAPNGPVQKAVRLIKEQVPELTVITDLCLCEYTSHGHCGIVQNNAIDNDTTLDCIQKIALSHAQSGCDVIAPSGVMDGVVSAIRSSLDRSGFENILTMPYSAKYASIFYGPFKTATKSVPGESKHATHQIDVSHSRGALRKIALDIEEGADIVIVKPALTSLDIIFQARSAYNVPIAAFNVSGEVRMLCSLCSDNPEDRRRTVMEALTCIRRAGADMIITYFAKEVAHYLAEGRSG